MAEQKTNNAATETVVWSRTFHRQNYDDETLTQLTEWEDLKYCIFTCGTNRHGRSQVIGYVQFKTPMFPEVAETLFPQLNWTPCKFGGRASVNYVNKCSNTINGTITEVGELWNKKK